MQVGKAYFELIDYLEAEKAFRLARLASPYSLEGMDIYSTVLYVSVLWVWWNFDLLVSGKFGQFLQRIVNFLIK